MSLIAIAEIPLTQDKVAIVDESDYDWLMEFKWSASFSSNNWKARRFTRRSGTIFMHRFILDALPGILVDHINHDGLDNRRSNLRLANHSQNGGNRLPQKGQASYKGVFLSKDNRWIARICKGRDRRYLGSFGTAIEAALAYDKAASELFGEFAYVNFQDWKGMLADGYELNRDR